MAIMASTGITARLLICIHAPDRVAVSVASPDARGGILDLPSRVQEYTYPGRLLANGFETGGTTAWSATYP
jgi:hypothetical protein